MTLDLMLQVHIEEMTHMFITMCFNCGEQGHVHPQCSKLNSSTPRVGEDIKNEKPHWKFFQQSKAQAKESRRANKRV